MRKHPGWKMPRILSFLLVLSLALPWPALPRAAERERLEAFLAVTGFDVALDSIRLTAASAPDMLGIDPGAFGSEWTRLADQVFDTGLMQDMALEILQQALDDAALTHAADFYASDLGQRLVQAENTSVMIEDDDLKRAEGTALVDAMVREGAPRLEILKRMNRAIDVTDTSARALQEIQLRFLLAASAAGVVDLKLDADGLRALMKSREGRLRLSISRSALAGAAYTYREISDADLQAYAQALEQPLMQQVYELMNAVQYEIMANRFEVLALRMADLQPGEDI